MSKYINFKAGYVCDSIAHLLQCYSNKTGNKQDSDKLSGLLEYVSAFDVLFPTEHTVSFDNLNSHLAVFNNIISRGLPTRVPLIVEEIFTEVGLINANSKEYEFDFYQSKQTLDFQTVFELLHILEPGLTITQSDYAGELGSQGEWQFLEKLSGDFPFIKQILQSERNFSTISQDFAGGRRLDFSFEIPYHFTDSPEKKRKGIIFEYDGVHHDLFDYKIYDKYRADTAKDVGFETLRQHYSEKGINHDISRVLNAEIFKIFAANYQRNSKDFLAIYTLLFVPLSVARLQKTLAELFLANPLLLQKDIITLAVIERDFPCGALAVQFIVDYFENLNSILTEESQCVLPKIKLTIFPNDEWVLDAKLHLGEKTENEDFFKNTDFDVILDHSLLKRSGIYKETSFVNPDSIIIRSAHYVDRSHGQARRTYCADLLKYEPLVEKEEDGNYFAIPQREDGINFFIQNIFRKKEYREGQLPIISRALQLLPVVGLMPTGGGKSLTFQLSAFMQPGLCMVIDPIKSLMEDQVRVMNSNWIDCCNYINSNITTEEKRKKLIDFRYGESMFLFVSPERLVMNEFRKIVSGIDSGEFGLAFSYCVIDEVHCVSEWGHDFRTTYLMLGQNLQKWVKTKSGECATLLGLTATASFDVLADIERELQIKHDDLSNAVIMIENTIRPELFFRVIDTDGKDRMQVLNADFAAMTQNLLQINQEEILKKSQRHHFEEFDKRDFATKETKNLLEEDKIKFQYQKKYLLRLAEEDDKNNYASVIFCPVKGQADSIDKENPNGVDRVFRELDLPETQKGFFYSSNNQTETNIVQRNFSDFTASKIRTMVCTKAFGMGIDKADIRSTYHFVYSGSLESFVQEAGRAGRDRKIAESVILLSRQKAYHLSHECLSKEFPRDKKENVIRNNYYRNRIRYRLMHRSYTSRESLEAEIVSTIENLNINNQNTRRGLIERLNRFIDEEYFDRGIHNYFFRNNFKGKDTEIGQIYNLFKRKEFTREKKDTYLQEKYNEIYDANIELNFWQGEAVSRLYIKSDGEDLGYINLDTGTFQVQDIHRNLCAVIMNMIRDENTQNVSYNEFFDEEEICDIDHQDTLINTFHNAEGDTFNFILAAEKIYPNVSHEICEKLGIDPGKEINPPKFTKTYHQQISSAIKYAADFSDFVLRLKEIGDEIKDSKVESIRRHLQFYYNRDRHHDPGNDTGRLNYRMHSMGFLEDYEIDYTKNNLFICTFRKHKTLTPYLNNIENYLKRYLSENTAKNKRRELEQKCNKLSLTDNILECLYFLSEFAYQEIADKRKRATDEIENLLLTSITEESCKYNKFAQNKFIKEQIYFYFNAKYARRGFKISNREYSLLDDYENSENNKKQLLYKYLDVFDKNGTQQNNYKHMIGSCKKIMRSLATTDLQKEWLLRLLKAFSLYCVNNPSYVSEANGELERGFENLYSDILFHNNDFSRIEEILEGYFKKLNENLQPNNLSFESIAVIRLKLLLKLQILGISQVVNKNKSLLKLNHA